MMAVFNFGKAGHAKVTLRFSGRSIHQYQYWLAGRRGDLNGTSGDNESVYYHVD